MKSGSGDSYAPNRPKLVSSRTGFGIKDTMAPESPLSSDELVSITRRNIAQAKRVIAELQKSIVDSHTAIEECRRMIEEGEALIAHIDHQTKH